MKDPTIHDLVKLVSDHYGITKVRAIMIMRSPLHPHGLRDNLAGRAMQGFMSRPLISGFDDEMIAERSYAIADTMLKERVK